MGTEFSASIQGRSLRGFLKRKVHVFTWLTNVFPLPSHANLRPPRLQPQLQIFKEKEVM